MEGSAASIVLQDPSGERLTNNFMKDYNNTNREVEARLVEDTWVLSFANGQVWEVPVALIEGA